MSLSPLQKLNTKPFKRVYIAFINNWWIQDEINQMTLLHKDAPYKVIDYSCYPAEEQDKKAHEASIELEKWLDDYLLKRTKVFRPCEFCKNPKTVPEHLIGKPNPQNKNPEKKPQAPFSDHSVYYPQHEVYACGKCRDEHLFFLYTDREM